MRKIIINGRFLTHKITGIQRYAIEMIKAIDINITKMKLNVDFEIVHPKGKLNTLNLKNIQEIEYGDKQGHLWEQYDLKKYKKNKNGILISLTGSGPVFDTDLIVIHDVGFMNSKFYNNKYKLWYKFITKLLIKNTKKVVTISQFSKNQIIKYFKPRKNIKVIYEGGEQIERIDSEYSIIKRLNLINQPFFFSLGSIKPNKNIDLIVKVAKEIPDYKFVITGEKNEKIFKKNKINLNLRNIIYTGYLNDNEIKALYEKCEAFIFPSFYEGFGLPPLEAILCGANLIVSDIPPLKEIYMDYGEFFNPNKENELIKIIKNKQYIDRRQNLKKLKKFLSWEFNSKLILKEIMDI